MPSPVSLSSSSLSSSAAASRAVSTDHSKPLFCPFYPGGPLVLAGACPVSVSWKLASLGQAAVSARIRDWPGYASARYGEVATLSSDMLTSSFDSMRFKDESILSL
ncbi:hypothetical protein U1Q18_052125 [Sarracenia purpurea var. burkii]